MSDAFASLPLAKVLLANLESLEYRRMTPIQAAVLPDVLAGRDLIAQARTGSGKTAAFGIGIVARIEPREPTTQALVLCPTRELADQVGTELRRIARATANLKLLLLCGGVPLSPQIASLRHGAHVVVGTPGRIGKHLRSGRLDLAGVKIVVLDEGDRMLDMGFAEEILAIVGHTPAARQTLLFSATYPAEIERMSASIQREPLRISVDEAHAALHIEQSFHEVEPARMTDAVAVVLAHHRPASTLVFCTTKIQCAALARALQERGVHALAIHGDLEQPERERVLTLFANGSCPVLVATDVAARGLDIEELQAVINVELPHDPEIYVHRIGRTGRAGATGLAVSLYGAGELPRLHAIEALQRAPARVLPLPVDDHERVALVAPHITLCIRAGRKDKLRPGDVLGALTNAGGIASAHVGKIDIADRLTYVAIDREHGDAALRHLQVTPIKGRRLAVHRVS